MSNPSHVKTIEAVSSPNLTPVTDPGTKKKGKKKGNGNGDRKGKGKAKKIMDIARARNPSAPEEAAVMPIEETPAISEAQAREEMMTLLKQMNLNVSSALFQSKKQIEQNKAHKFWDTQPVPRLLAEKKETCGPIDERKTPAEVRQTPYNMPTGFEWCTVDLKDMTQADEVYVLLTDNYVEDDDNMFRFDYSREFLRWALQPPGYEESWHVGVRSQKSGKLMAFISGIPAHIRIYEDTMRMAEINFLCVHKKLRTKRLTPVLIKEVTRRVNLTDTWQAVYTAGVVLPRPVSSCRYYHRSLNPKKLIEVGFSRLADRDTMIRTIKRFKLSDHTSIAGFRQMEPKDIPEVFVGLKQYLSDKDLSCVFESEVELGHWILPREGVIDSFVVENPDSGKVTDMCSFYHLPSTIIGNEKHNTLRAAYSYYSYATSVTLTDLTQDCLIMANKMGFDVFNALDIMGNEEFLEPLKFGIGDGHLQYYLYNWLCPETKPCCIGLVLC